MSQLVDDDSELLNNYFQGDKIDKKTISSIDCWDYSISKFPRGAMIDAGSPYTIVYEPGLVSSSERFHGDGLRYKISTDDEDMTYYFYLTSDAKKWIQNHS